MLTFPDMQDSLNQIFKMFQGMQIHGNNRTAHHSAAAAEWYHVDSIGPKGPKGPKVVISSRS
jgi:hypothetical protein